MSFLRLVGLKKRFPDGTEAVKGLDLSVEEGEFMVLLGPSGCGKTTTLRMVAGLETPTGGQVRIAGQDATHLRPSQRNVGFVFQFYALYPHMTVRQNIAFPLENIGISRPERDRVLTRVGRRLGLAHLLDSYPRQLSGGDQQRVSLARAMVRTPSLYLMDEPLGALDADHRLELRKFIRSQQLEMSVTAIYVTHDQEEAMSLADRMVVMDAGKICQVGSPSEVYDHPASLFVANFVGSPGMNLIRGRILSDNGTPRFAPNGTEATIPLDGSVRSGPAVLGIRPEYIRPGSDGIPGSVLLNVYLGGHRILHLDTPFGRLVMRAPLNDSYARGETLHLQFEPGHIRLFDSTTGNQYS